jgi:RNA polymerase sigma-70 factor (ECF subfamily)
MSGNEKKLVEKAKSGDIGAFEKLIEGHQKKVFNIALRMIGNYDEASELAQEAFLRAFKSIKSFKGDSLFSTWIYKITTNVCLDEIRRKKKKKLISLDEDIEHDGSEFKRQIKDDSPGPESVAENNELKRMVKESINLLPGDYKVVLVLRDINCPTGTVKSRINRARQALKKILQKNGELIIEEFVK